jgi:predicted RND superfamily exporter protein
MREALLHPFFRFVLAKRWWIVGVYAALLAASVPFALKVDQDNAIDRLIVQDDPDYLATQAFAKVFGAGEYVVLFAETDRPFAPEVLAALQALEAKLSGIPRVSLNSVFTVYHRARPDADPAADPAAFRAFVTGTPLFSQQGLVGAGFYGLPLILDVEGAEQRVAALTAIDAAVAERIAAPAPLTALRKVGEPYVNDYLNRGASEGGMKQFPLFGLFVVVLVMGLYRSWRTLAAFVVAMAVNVALAVGYIGLVGGTFTIVSVLIPMTLLVTCLATLVYTHSRYVEQPPGSALDDHHVAALSNKFLACTASVLASAIGFAALAVSDIRPIREMGLWLSVGLLITWAINFTLFPALQKILKTPTQAERKIAAQWFLGVAAWMPKASYRWRWVSVPLSLVLCGLGAVALFGFPGVLPPMQMLTHPVDYVNADTDLYKDTKRVEQLIPGLSVADVWLHGKVGTLNQPEVIRGLDAFQRALEAEPLVGSAVGPTTVLRMLRYIGGNGDQLPTDPDELEALTDTLEGLLESEPLLSKFVNKGDMSDTHVTLITRINDFPTYQALGQRVAELWKQAVQKEPALAEFTVGPEGPVMAGLGRLQTKVSHNLVPTLTESFALTVLIIFSVFLVVFRNGAARLMAMIPSLFAILVMFGLMRLFGMSLNVATILIASTVLGTSENDQIHFFYHFLEGKQGATTEAGLRHTMLIAGRSIFFATLINAVGFLAFALSDLPPIRQFALLASIAFTLSMLADFTALPGALWMVFHDKPDQPRPDGQKAGEE